MDVIDQFTPGIGNNSNKEVNILCCLCGTVFNPGLTKTNICVKCLGNQTDITSGITKHGIVNYCKLCKRYLGEHWIHAKLESKELLTMCLKKIKGLNKVTLIDASFIWTEPHSKRIKVKLTIQKEIMNNTSISQSFLVEFVVHDLQCEDCKKEFTPHTWVASIQLRQKANHKKTFFFLEQLILKHNAHDKVLNIKESHEGLDFFFKSKAHAMKMIDFLQSLFPIRCKSSKQLISQDDHSNTTNYKYVFSVEIPKICKDDLVAISPRLSSILGGCSQILLCLKVTSMIHLLDPMTLKTIEMNGQTYFQYEGDMTFLSAKNSMAEFMVFDVDKQSCRSLNSSILSLSKSKISTVTIGRTSDWESFQVKTNLGDILNEGNMVLGYDLTSLNLNGMFDNPKAFANAPDVILIKKIYPERKKNKKRIWKLKHLDKEEEKMNNIHKSAAQQKEKDYEEFLDELEEDPELRAQINLYRNEKVINEIQEKKNMMVMINNKKNNLNENEDLKNPTIASKELVKKSKTKRRVEEYKKEGGKVKEVDKDKDKKGANDDDGEDWEDQDQDQDQEDDSNPKKVKKGVEKAMKKEDLPPEIKLEELLSELVLEDKQHDIMMMNEQEEEEDVEEVIAKVEGGDKIEK